jgi:hypothetical protein
MHISTWYSAGSTKQHCKCCKWWTYKFDIHRTVHRDMFL